MKKLLLGLTLLASISSFASLNDLREEFSNELNLGTVASFKVQTFKSCLSLSLTMSHLRSKCFEDIPELLDLGLTAEDINNIALSVKEEEATKVRTEKDRTQQIKEIEESVDNLLNI